MGRRTEIDYNKIYKSHRYGNYIILKEVEPIIGSDGYPDRQVKIKFLQTGTECITYLSSAISEQVRDPYFPIYFNVGYIGTVKNPTFHILHDTWYRMLSRCYNHKDNHYMSYGSIGVSVDQRWHNFENFIYDCQFLYNYDKFISTKGIYQLDKDYLQQNVPKNKRVYSKDTCIFLNRWDNINLRTIENKETHKSKYYGVWKNNSSSYKVDFYTNGKLICRATLDNEIAAANMYNTYAEKYDASELVPLRNDVPYMSPEEVMTHIKSDRDLIKNV